ncbi:MAG: DNRLRE domain-containing protein [Nitrosopumilus sp.]
MTIPVANLILRPTGDSYMDQGDASSHSAETTFILSQNGVADNRPIMRFDVSAFASSRIVTATIQMFCTASSGAQSTNWALRRIVRSTWAPTTVSWANYNGGTWTTAGASNDPADFSATNQLTGNIPSNQDLIGFYDFGDISNLVVDAIDNRSGILHLCLTLTQNRTTTWTWGSAEATAPNETPQLLLGVRSLAGEAQLLLQEG